MNEISPEPKHSKAPSGRTQWHRILGALLELLLTRLGIIVQSEVQVMSDPPKVDIVLLRREGNRWSEEQLHLLCDGIRNTIAKHVLVEFKYSESLSIDALLQALGYHYFYRQSQSLSEAELQTFVMVAITPRRQLLEHFGYSVSEVPGVYRSQQPLLEKVQLIVLNQLQPSPHNAFVQCFASQRRVYQSAFTEIQKLDEAQLSQSAWALVAGLQRQREKKGEIMKAQTEELTAERLIEIGSETRKFVLATLSAEDKRQVIAHMRPEDLLAGIAPEDRLAGLAPEDRLAGLAPEDRLAGLDSEEIEQLVEKVPLEKRLSGLVSKERLAALTPEDTTRLLEQIEAFLSQQQSSEK